MKSTGISVGSPLISERQTTRCHGDTSARHVAPHETLDVGTVGTVLRLFVKQQLCYQMKKKNNTITVSPVLGVRCNQK